MDYEHGLDRMKLALREGDQETFLAFTTFEGRLRSNLADERRYGPSETLRHEQHRIIESLIRGVVIGAIISVSFSFLQQHLTWTYFFAGIVYGLVIDIVSTLLVRKLIKNKE